MSIFGRLGNTARSIFSSPQMPALYATLSDAAGMYRGQDQTAIPALLEKRKQKARNDALLPIIGKRLEDLPGVQGAAQSYSDAEGDPLDLLKLEQDPIALPEYSSLVSRKGDLLRAGAQRPPSEPGTLSERNRKILEGGKTDTQEYAAVFASEAKPQPIQDEITGRITYINPDMSMWAPPTFRLGSPGQPGQPAQGAQQGQAPQAYGTPTITQTEPIQGVALPIATARANLAQGQRDLDIAKKLLFPGGKDGELGAYDRGAAMSAAWGVPLTEGRNAGQAIRRAVEIILRSRTQAAAPAAEVDSYVKMYTPSVLDNDEGAATKMRQLGNFFSDAQSWLDGGRQGEFPAPLGNPPPAAPGGAAPPAQPQAAGSPPNKLPPPPGLSAEDQEVWPWLAPEDIDTFIARTRR